VSKLVFSCVRCKLTGSRDYSYKALPGQTPNFTDICPGCRSTDIEVSNPAHAERRDKELS
jgi:hypothetical protein